MQGLTRLACTASHTACKGDRQLTRVGCAIAGVGKGRGGQGEKDHQGAKCAVKGHGCNADDVL
jgi:hypothetical protein